MRSHTETGSDTQKQDGRMGETRRLHWREISEVGVEASHSVPVALTLRASARPQHQARWQSRVDAPTLWLEIRGEPARVPPIAFVPLPALLTTGAGGRNVHSIHSGALGARMWRVPFRSHIARLTRLRLTRARLVP